MGTSVFLFGFAKSERGNIEDDRLKSFKEIAEMRLKTDKKVLEDVVKRGLLQEVDYGDKKQKA